MIERGAFEADLGPSEIVACEADLLTSGSVAFEAGSCFPLLVEPSPRLKLKVARRLNI